MSYIRISFAMIFQGVLFGVFLLFSSSLVAQPNDSTLANIKKAGKLVVGTDIPYGVMEFYDDTGKPAGIDMEIAGEIASRLGVAMEVETMPFSNLFDSLKDGAVDMLASAVTITPERQASMRFSQPYLKTQISIAVHFNNTTIQSLDDLEGKALGVLAGTTEESLTSEIEYLASAKIISYEFNDERLQALQEGKLDAMVVQSFVKSIPTLRLIGEPLSESSYGIVTRQGSHALMTEIDKILKDLQQSGKLDAITQKYATMLLE